MPAQAGTGRERTSREEVRRTYMKTFFILPLTLSAVLLSGCTVTYTRVTSDIPAVATWGKKLQNDLVFAHPCGADTKQASVEVTNTASQVRKGVVRETSEMRKVCQ